LVVAVTTKLDINVLPREYCKYIWFGEFDSNVPDRDKLSQVVDYLLTREVTMSERFRAAEDFTRYYEQITGDTAPEFEMKRLFDWVRQDYNYEDYPCCNEQEMRFVRKTQRKYEVYAPKGFIGTDGEFVDWLVGKDSQIKRKGGMIPFQSPWDDKDEE
jgi:hypothetical protein